MPFYNYIDKITGKTVEVLRSFKEYDVIPDREEAKDWTDEEYEAAEWDRLIGKDQVVQGFGAKGLGGKGFW